MTIEHDGIEASEKLEEKTCVAKLGIIYPPVEIRAIIDKTSHFVAKNGISFEQKIVAQQGFNAKFSFLNPTDPYHLYYRAKLKDSLSDESAETSQNHTVPEPQKNYGGTAAKVTENNVAVSTTRTLEKPGEELYTVHVPAGLTVLEVDIIKLTAQFAARNGKTFLTGLFQREQNNHLFAFIRPNNSLFPFFTNLVDAYQRVILAPKEMQDSISRDSNDCESILLRCLKRLEFEKALTCEQQIEEDQAEKEKLEMLSIDWHQFTVVETIEFFDDEDKELPAPKSLGDVILMNKARRNTGVETTAGSHTYSNRKVRGSEQMSNTEVELPTKNYESSGIHVVREDTETIKVIKDYARHPVPHSNNVYYANSPFTGERVALNDMAEHIRTNLIDPRWKDQRQSMLNKFRNDTKATDNEIASNILNLAKHRPDVFGSTRDDDIFKISSNMKHENLEFAD